MDELNPNNGTQEIGELETMSELPTEEMSNAGSEEDFSLPENSNDRTKEQFSKLLQSNKELNQSNKELMDKLQQLESLKQTDKNAYSSVYETFKSDPFSAVTTQDYEYVDENGDVDIERLNKDLKELKMSTLEAKRLAEQAREDVEIREAHMKHPYLDPQNQNFDPQFFELVKDRVLRQKFYEKKNIPLVDVANQVFSFYKPNVKSNAKSVEEQKKVQQQVTQNAPISSSTGRRQEGPNLEDLKNRTMKGDSRAIQERLKALGI
jgi:hypothetical protein